MPVTVADFVRSVDAGGKFVLLRSRSDADDGVLAFSDFTRDSQHRDIVERWRNGMGKSPMAQAYRVDGGGWWKYDPAEKALLLYGQSAAYGRYDRDWLRDNMPQGTIFGESRVTLV